MTTTIQPRARRLLAATTVLYLGGALVTAILGPVLSLGGVLVNGAFLAIGALVFVRKSGNLIGPVLMAIGLTWNTIQAADVIAGWFADSGEVHVASWITWAFSPLVPFGLWLQIPMIVLFPHGHPASTWDRSFLWVTGMFATAIALFSLVARPVSLMDPTVLGYPHPFLDAAIADPLGGVFVPLAAGPLFLAYLVAVIRLVLRARRSDSVERRQIGWVAFTFGVFAVLGTANVAFDPLGSIEGGFQLLNSVLTLVVPIGISVAIFRYRLYDIDVIVSKSVAYLGLAATIAGLYATVVVLPLLVVGRSDGEGPGLLLPIVAAAVVAVVFEPVRSRMQRWADRLVYGERATPHEVLSQLTSRLAESTVGGGTDDLARLLALGTGAERAVVWLETDDVLEPDGVFFRGTPAPIEPVPVGGLVDDELTASRPVAHHGEGFGAVTITKGSDDPIAPDDLELLSDVAAGAGLLLRNIALNRELELRAEEVRASRRRLIAAQDSERHRLERDLHDGAQQQVVALKVKLGIAKTIAEREGADDIVARVTALTEETQQAVDALRTVAHGIYPPLLQSDGLDAALGAIERTSQIPLTIDTDHIDRYPRSIEETVYFSVLETVERARMAGATGVTVRLTGFDDELAMLVDVHDASNLDVTVVFDRVDAAGGTLSIDETTDITALTARLPALSTTTDTDLVSEPS